MKIKTPLVSDWVKKYAVLIPLDEPVLDVACGSGCNTRFLLKNGHKVVALDRDIGRLADISHNPNLEIYKFDLETGSKFPFQTGKFSGIVVTNYLYRPLFNSLIKSLGHGGVLIYQTFMTGNEIYGRPNNLKFLLSKNELNDFFREKLSVIAFEEGYIENPKPAVVQSICAINN
jgi:SAM-dependent methyltransferase